MGRTDPFNTDLPNVDAHPASTPRRHIRAEAVALLRIAQAGDRDAFGQLYASYAPAVGRYVTTRMRDRDRDAIPDLVQDTFAAALEELDHADDDVEGWLIQLAAKMCTRHSWSHRRYLRAALTLGERQQENTLGGTTPPGPQDDSPMTPAVIAQAMAGLDPRERLTLQLRFLDGHRYETAARIMGCSVWTAKQRQRRALRQLADQLANHRHDPAARLR